MRRILGFLAVTAMVTAIGTGSAFAFGGCAGMTKSVKQSTPITTAQTPATTTKSGG